MTFVTVVNCIDGMVQAPVIDFLKKRFGVDYVDCITEASPVRILSGLTNRRQVQSILDRIELSIVRHKSKAIAVVAHQDCVAGAADKAQLLEWLDISVKYLIGQYSTVETIGLWVDENLTVTEMFLHD